MMNYDVYSVNEFSQRDNRCTFRFHCRVFVSTLKEMHFCLCNWNSLSENVLEAGNLSIFMHRLKRFNLRSIITMVY